MSNLFAFGDKVIGGGESSQSDGHIIQNPSGTAMPTQPNLQFADANVENDSTNNATVVRSFVDIDWDDWQEVDDNDDTYYRVTDAPLVDGNVEVDLMKKLWENSDPSQSFISQTITFPSADYDMLRIYYNESVGGRYNSVEIPKGLNGALTFSAIGGTNSTYIENRSFTRNSDTSYTFGSGQYTLNDGSLVTDNTVLIPIAVYGIKQKFRISLSAIISNVSTSASKCMLSDGETSVEDTLNYSTDEHVVGKWIDGSTLYEKTVSCGALPNNTTKYVAHNISNLGTVIEANGMAKSADASNPSFNVLPIAHPTLSPINIFVTLQNICLETSSNWSSLYPSSYITLRYTKTS